MVLSVATCQFPVSADISQNLDHIVRQIREAKVQGTQVVHFCETALSGYAGADFENLDNLDWSLLRDATRNIMALARELRIWVVLGSTHQLSAGHRPHNSLYIIDDHGQIIDRYDKRFCSGDVEERTGDLAHYTSGDHFSVFDIAGVRCGALICHDYRYPELYRAYFQRGVKLMFHSYHAGGVAPETFAELAVSVGTADLHYGATPTLPGITMPAGMIAAASNNFMFISCPNSSREESCWGSFLVRPDGVITGHLERNCEGVLISEVDTSAEFYDSTVAWRDRAIAGVYHSGELVADPRSRDRQAF